MLLKYFITILCRCTVFFGTPTLYVDMMSVFEKLSPEQQQQQNMKVAITGGAPCSPALMTKFKKMFPAAKLMVWPMVPMCAYSLGCNICVYNSWIVNYCSPYTVSVRDDGN